LDCPPGHEECYELNSEDYSLVAAGIALITEDDGLTVDYSCSDIRAGLDESLANDDITAYSVPNDSYDAYASMPGDEISFHDTFLVWATAADIAWMAIHERRHNEGDDHPWQPTDAEAFEACTNAW
jgi:hypothetical protein